MVWSNHGNPLTFNFPDMVLFKVSRKSEIMKQIFLFCYSKGCYCSQIKESGDEEKFLRLWVWKIFKLGTTERELAAGKSRIEEEERPKPWLLHHETSRYSCWITKWGPELSFPQTVSSTSPFINDLCSVPLLSYLSTLKLWSKIPAPHITFWVIMYVMPWSHFCIFCKAHTTLPHHREPCLWGQMLLTDVMWENIPS